MLVLQYNNWFDNWKDNKFLTKWEGPFWVVKQYVKGSYKLQDVNGKVHETRLKGWRLKPYFLWFEVGATNSSSDQEDKGDSFPSKQDWE